MTIDKDIKNQINQCITNSLSQQLKDEIPKKILNYIDNNIEKLCIKVITHALFNDQHRTQFGGNTVESILIRKFWESYAESATKWTEENIDFKKFFKDKS